MSWANVLKHGENEYKLKFNCKPCEMEIWEKDAELVFEDEDEQLGYVKR